MPFWGYRPLFLGIISLVLRETVLSLQPQEVSC